MDSMRYLNYQLPGTSLRATLAGPIEAAAIAAARFDERLLRSAAVLADGVRARADFAEAQALVRLGGGLAPLEEIVLSDAQMDARLPAREVIRAVSLVSMRRSFMRADAGAMLTPAAIRAVLGVDGAPPGRTGGPPGLASRTDDKALNEPDGLEVLDGLESEADGEALNEPDGLEVLDGGGPAGLLAESGDFAELDAILARTRRSLGAFNDLSTKGGRQRLTLADPGYDEPARLEAWLTALEAAQNLPAALAAAIALDAWLMLEPSEHQGELGFLLAAAVLRQRGLAKAHLPALAAGLSRSRFRWRPDLAAHARLSGLIAAIGQAASLGMADLDRLSLAREVMLRQCLGKSKNSRLAALIGLFASAPLITVAIAAKALNVTPQGAAQLLSQLGPALPRELTGRKRYRAWGIV